VSSDGEEIADPMRIQFGRFSFSLFCGLRNEVRQDTPVVKKKEQPTCRSGRPLCRRLIDPRRGPESGLPCWRKNVGVPECSCAGNSEKAAVSWFVPPFGNHVIHASSWCARIGRHAVGMDLNYSVEAPVRKHRSGVTICTFVSSYFRFHDDPSFVSEVAPDPLRSQKP